MRDQECVRFLQWALPLLDLQWKGFRRVRRQVCKRLGKRVAELALFGLDQYKEYLQQNPQEWSILDMMCRITISRFYRNRSVFDFLAHEIIPELITTLRSQGGAQLRVWSCGCASGEEAYTMALLWHYALQCPSDGIALTIMATDIDPVMIARAKKACYSASSVRSLPNQWVCEAFHHEGKLLRLKQEIKEHVRFHVQDIRRESPAGSFHVILCRNQAFTYCTDDVQQRVLSTLAAKLNTNGILVTGSHENPSPGDTGLRRVVANLPVFRKG